MIVLEFFPIFGFHAWKFINYNSFPKGSVVGAFHTCVYIDVYTLWSLQTELIFYIFFNIICSSTEQVLICV